MHQYNSNSNCSAAGVSTALVRFSDVGALLGPLLDTFELFERFVFAERLLLFALDELLLTYELLIFFRRPVDLCSFAFGGGGIFSILFGRSTTVFLLNAGK